MIWLCVFLLILCVVTYFGIEPYKSHKLHKKEKARQQLVKEKMENQEKVRRNLEKFQEKQRIINEKRRKAREEIDRELQENRRRNEILKQTLSKKDYDTYMKSQAQNYVFARGGHGNQILTGFEYGWTKGDIDDKDSQGKLTKR